jgi:hypothetical protein
MHHASRRESGADSEGHSQPAQYHEDLEGRVAVGRQQRLDLDRGEVLWTPLFFCDVSRYRINLTSPFALPKSFQVQSDVESAGVIGLLWEPGHLSSISRARTGSTQSLSLKVLDQLELERQGRVGPQ